MLLFKSGFRFVSFTFNFVLRKTKLDLIFFKLNWRLKNKHNKTLPLNLFDSTLVKVGKMSYGPLHIHSWGADNEQLIIGDYVSIASGVKFLLGGNHQMKSFSTFPHRVMSWGEKQEATSKGPIVVENDVWIASDSMILSGVRLGYGSIIAAGSIVTKSVPAFAIVGGNPAKIIKYRFSDEILSELLKLNLTDINWKILSAHKQLIYEDLNSENLKKISTILNKN